MLTHPSIWTGVYWYDISPYTSYTVLSVFVLRNPKSPLSDEDNSITLFRITSFTKPSTYPKVLRDLSFQEFQSLVQNKMNRGCV